MLIDKLATKKILVTGGGGYLGGRVVEYLSSCGDFVVVPTTRTTSPKNNTTQRSSVLHIDWNNDEQVKDVFHDLYGVVHLSGLNAQACATSTEAELNAELELVEGIFENAAKFKVQRFVHISTMHVYGPNLQQDIDENTLASNPHPYAKHHIDKENVLRAKAKKTGPKLTILRLSNGFGRPSEIADNCWMLVANQLCRQAVENEMLVLNSSGQQQRDFIPISSIASAIELVLLSSLIEINEPVYNLGSNWSPKLIDLAQLVAKRYAALTSKEIKVTTKDESQVISNQALNYSIDKLKNIGYHAPSEDDIHHEIDELINFCLDHLEVHNA